jgi:RNA polymerase sigma-70 factor (ECF subfamily)
VAARRPRRRPPERVCVLSVRTASTYPETSQIYGGRRSRGEEPAGVTDESLGSARASDASALWEGFASPLRAFLAKRVPSGVDPNDLLQDVFLRVVRHLGSLRGTDRPEAWLFQIARNALRDSLRARQRRDGRTDPLEVDLPAEADVEADQAAEAELAPCLTAMIGRLAEPYRTAIELTSLRGLTQADAARHTGVSVSGMKSRVQRGREQLRQLLVRCCEIDLDARGGVSDFHPRATGACGNGNPSVGRTGCGSRGPCN